MRRILVVEDEFLVAIHIGSILEDDGVQVVGPVGSLSEAVKIASDEVLDGALLDINIMGGRVDDVADILARRQVPFMFLTAYGRDHLPKNFSNATLIAKPFTVSNLLAQVHNITAP